MNPATTSARTVVDELVACGVTDAVLCPGSRNAPLAFALHAADAAGRLRLHVRIDERTAGFLALGLALGSGRPVPVATTSGTAAANLLPAVLDRIGPWTQPRLPPPPPDHIRLNFLAPSGLHFGQAPFGVFEQDALAGPVVRAATGLLQAMMAVNQR